MKEHLKEISSAVPEERHAVVILDGASWHTTQKIRIFKNLSIMILPPASPELNPVEQIWQQLRDIAI